MSKFAQKAAKAERVGAIKTTEDTTSTYEGAEAWKFDEKSEVFLLAVTNMVSERTFYETAQDRDSRFRDLIAKVVKNDPEWVKRFIPYLRNTMNMRSASIVLAAEYLRNGGPTPREVVSSALSRADEPAEILAYWSQYYGKNFPMPLKRGVADAVIRLYNQKSAIKYDGVSRVWRMGDVIEITHPKPNDQEQSLLFKYLLDRRHRGTEAEVPLLLSNILAAHSLEKLPVEARRKELGNPDFLKEAGFTWEKLSGWLNGPMDAEAWEAIIPSMGYMALLRNLRNFDDAGISKDAVEFVKNKLTDPEQVARSRQFPFRFYSAYKNTESTRWSETLEQALELSLNNVPKFDKKTLILSDVSGSMSWAASFRSNIQMLEVGAVFAAAVAKNTPDVDLVAFATVSKPVKISATSSVLKTVEKINRLSKELGGGTEIYKAIKNHIKDHEKVVIFTDMQAFPGKVPDTVKELYTFDLLGYGKSYAPTGKKGFYTFGGYSDAIFTMLKLLEDFNDDRWPF